MLLRSHDVRLRFVPVLLFMAVATGGIAQQAGTGSPGPVYKVGNGVTPPRAISIPDPVYPEEARRQRLEGTVVLWLVVGPEGGAHNVRVARSLGHGFDEAAIAAVEQWKFEPAKKDGQPVAVQVNVEVNFRLGKSTAATQTAPGQAASADDYQSQMLSRVGVSVDLPIGWTLLGEVQPSYTRPAVMMFRQPGTLASLALSRTILEASPELFLKLMQAQASKEMDDFRVLSTASIQRDGWGGVRLTATFSKNDIQVRQIAEVFSRENEHYAITMTAPEEAFLKHGDEFIRIVASVRVKGIAAAAMDPGRSAKSATAMASTAPAAELAYQAGLQSAAKADFSTAVRQFGDAVAQAPAHPMAWNDLGRSYLRLRRFEDAIAALRKQIEVNPRHQFAYNNLGLALEAEGKFSEAESAFRQQIAVHGEDRYAHANLGRLLVQQRQYAAAVPELQAAIRNDPRNSSLSVYLGMAYLGQGQKDNGVVILEEAVRGSSNPTILNNVAYQLAEFGLELDRARQYSESALAIIAPLLNNIDLSRVTSDDLRHVLSLATFWDTLGWIRYMSGDLKAAERYLRASWELSHLPVVGAHLAEVLDRTGRKDEAAGYYAAAVAADEAQPHGNVSEPKELSSARTRLEAIAGSPAAAKARIDAAAQPAAIKVGAPGAQGEADFLVLIGPGAKAEDGRFVGGNVALRRLEANLKAVSYPISFPAPTTAKIMLRLHAKCEGSQACTATIYDSRRAAEMALPEAASIAP